MNVLGLLSDKIVIQNYFSPISGITVKCPWILFTLKTFSKPGQDKISARLRFNISPSACRRDNSPTRHVKDGKYKQNTNTAEHLANMHNMASLISKNIDSLLVDEASLNSKSMSSLISGICPV